MKTTEETKKIKEMTDIQLKSELAATRKKLAGDILRVKAGKLDNYSLIKKNKRFVARITTILNEKVVK
jgi:ribosomal protein L29